MNCLIVYPDEIGGDGVVRLSGDRAQRARERHQLKLGVTVTAGVRNGRLGQGTVIAEDVGEYQLKLNLERDPPARSAAELIVAVPRPQTVKKVIHLACTLGIERLHLVRTIKTVKSYLTSSVLSPLGVEGEVLEGLEQSVDTVGPEIVIHRSFENFGRDVLPAIAARTERRFIADTVGGAADTPNGELSHLRRGKGGARAVAIGPEAGWSDLERGVFAQTGFERVGLGPRMLRVEVAAAVALAQFGGFSRGES